jgi:glycosyltransferase involved in cell wall biosynthesis
VVTETGGGPEKTIFSSPRFLEPFGYRVVCAYMHPPGDPGFEALRRKARAMNARLEAIEDRGPFDLRVVKRLLEICRTSRVAIWHGHDYKSNAIGLFLRRFWPMRLVTTVHGWGKFTRRTPLYYAVDRWCHRHYEKVICVSEDLYQRCLNNGVPRGRCVLVHNAIDVEQYARRMPPREAKAPLGLEADRLLIGAVGRLSEEKNFQGLIRACDRLLSEGLEFQLAIIGEGDQRAPLSELIAGLGRGDRIRLLGYRADTIDLYQAMDAFVLSSLREGLPNVLLEAMATEVPVVATRIAGVPKLVEHEVNGLLVEPGDIGGLAEGLRRLLIDADLRRSLATAGRRTVEESYSFEARMAKVRAIYEELLGGPPVQGKCEIRNLKSEV